MTSSALRPDSPPAPPVPLPSGVAPPAGPRFRRTACLKLGILLKNPDLPAFLPETDRIVRSARDVDSVLGWGYMPSARAARAFAAERGLPYLAVEDGFLRSLRLGVERVRALSLIVDPVGMYYDATAPSHMESLLNGADWFDPAMEARALAGMAALRRHRLTKYNAAPDLTPDRLPDSERERVLVIDQTYGDNAIRYGMADAAAFTRMLEAAIDENPGAEVIVKIHPVVAAGKRRGHLLDAARTYGCTVLADACNPWSLLERCQAAYVVTSQVGLEALAAGLRVRCFGLPFYAGWGATGDDIATPRRVARCSPAKIFAAAFLRYARYVDPFTGQPSTFEATVETLARWRRLNEANRGGATLSGVPAARRPVVRRLLTATQGALSFTAADDQASGRGKRRRWGMEADADSVAAALGLGGPVGRALCALVVEDGPVWHGPRLAALLAAPPADPEHRAEARRLLALLQAAAAAAAPAAASRWPAERRRVAVVAPPAGTGDEAADAYADAARAAHVGENAALLWLPRPGGISAPPPGRFDAVAHPGRLLGLLATADVVHVFDAAAGLAPTILGKKVVTHGKPLYADPASSLEDVVTAALIAYPRYLDPRTGLPCPADVAVARALAGESVPGVAGRALAWRLP